MIAKVIFLFFWWTWIQHFGGTAEFSPFKDIVEAFPNIQFFITVTNMPTRLRQADEEKVLGFLNNYTCKSIISNQQTAEDWLWNSSVRSTVLTDKQWSTSIPEDKNTGDWLDSVSISLE